MFVSKYRFIFFNIIIIFLFITNQFILCFLLILMRLPYWLNVESNIEYQFLYFYKDLDGINAGHLDYDTDSEFYYILLHEEAYLFSNCRFFFDALGGETTLDYIDFCDFSIYNINDKKNYKYIYNNNFFYRNYNKNEFYAISNIKKKYVINNNNKYFLKKVDQQIKEQNSLYNVINNKELMNNIKEKQRIKSLLKK